MLWLLMAESGEGSLVVMGQDLISRCHLVRRGVPPVCWRTFVCLVRVCSVPPVVQVALV